MSSADVEGKFPRCRLIAICELLRRRGCHRSAACVVLVGDDRRWMEGSGYMRIAIAGGTGVLGRAVQKAVQQAGHESQVLARSVGVDVTTGVGVDAALSGVQAVIDVSGTNTSRRSKAIDFFSRGSEVLLRAGRHAGVQHHVMVSIVGVDRVDFGYYQGKLAQERLVLGSSQPVSVLRATQFHEFAVQLLERGRGLAVVPKMKSQPAAASEVAHALVELAVGPPVGMAPEFAGPREEEMLDLVRRVKAHTGRRRALLSVRFPGEVGYAMANGGLLPLQDGPRGTQTFAEWLDTLAVPVRAT